MSGATGLRKHGHTTVGDGGVISTANDPSAGEKAALVGTSGTPGSGNKYVTDADSRNTNSRTPTAHATSHKSGGSDAIRLDELAVPTADVSLNTHKLTSVTDPSGPQDAATKAYVDGTVGAAGGLSDHGVVTYLDYQVAAAPAAPAAGYVRHYAKTGSHIAQKDSGGTETLLDATGGGGAATEVFGDGSDGDCTVNSGTFTLTLASGEALISSNQLQRDAYFHDLTLNGGDLQTRSFRVYVSGTLTMTSGVLKNNGNTGGTGGNGTSGAGGAAGAAPTATATGTLTGGTGLAGVVGGFNANGTTGATGQASTHGHTVSNTAVAGGDSGQGQTGGVAGTRPATAFTSTERIKTGFHAIAHRTYSAFLLSVGAIVGVPPGGGSGAGSPSSGGGGSGGNGSNGGAVVIVVNTITGTTNIQCLGGTGGAGGNGGGTNAGGGAGGNGGNGGTLLFSYRDKTGWSGSLDASGGSGGTGGTGIGTGSVGGNGSAGVTGWVLQVQV